MWQQSILLIDASIRRSPTASAAVASVLTAVAIVGLFAALIVAGLDNSYSFTVIDRPESSLTRANGVELVSSEQICGDGEEYSGCVNMHVAVYNSACLSPGPSWVDSSPLTPASVSTCASLLDFIEEAKAQSDACGYGCTTTTGGSGEWGWAYLSPRMVTQDVVIEGVSHREYCWFVLGPFGLGSCTGER